MTGFVLRGGGLSYIVPKEMARRLYSGYRVGASGGIYGVGIAVLVLG